MRYRLFVFLFVLSLSACSFNVDVVTPSAEATIPPAVLPVDASPTSIPQTDTAIPSATPTAISEVIVTPLPESSGVYPIQFPPNGTYVDIPDGLTAGTKKTYSISALQGQVMSISIRLSPNSTWTIAPMKIVGRDGTILCPVQVNDSCYYWHGTLPATQEYLVTLMPDADVRDFTMRVAIDPPGTTSQSFPYVSKDGKASFTYTDEFAPVLFPELFITKSTPELALQLIDTKMFDHTNLSEAYFLFDATNDPNIVASCTEPLSASGPENVNGEANVNGITFTRSEGSGVGAGNIYEQTYYRTAYQGSCYEVTLFVHSTNIGNYSSDSGVKEFDRAALNQKFEGILSTLILK
jgi:hypothetical protein